MSPARRHTALFVWITVALAGAGLAWLGLVGIGLLLTQRAPGMERDWVIGFAVLGVGLAVFSAAMWMIGRIRRRT